jgi:hypothetical protein
MGHIGSALARFVVGSLLYVASRFVYDVEVHGLEHDTGAPHTYLAISHKRDPDSFVPTPSLLWHRGWRAYAGEVRFVMRSDAFEPGFLARLVPQPRWFAWLLRPISVGPAVRALGIYPLTNLRERPAEIWIREFLQAEGDVRAGDVLAPPFIELVAAAVRRGRAEVIARRPLSRLLAWRYQLPLQDYASPDMFLPDARKRAERRVLATVKRELAVAADWLWQSGSLLGAPEGKLSSDGRLSPITSGLHRLLEAGPPDTRVVPVFMIYDFMTVQRPRLFINLAPAILNAPALASRALDDRLRQGWLGCGYFTCTQLASGFLVEATRSGVTTFALEDLAKHLVARAGELARAGRYVDRHLLRPRRARARAASYLAYAERHGLVRRAGRGMWTPMPVDLTVTVPPMQVGYNKFPLAYAWNELQEMLSLSEPTANETAQRVS